MIIEQIILNYLSKKMSTPAYIERDEKMPERYILIDKAGSGRENYINKATIAVQSYEKTRYKAALLNEEVKETMEAIVELDEIASCRLNSDYDYTDTTKKEYRYQAVFDITHY